MAPTESAREENAASLPDEIAKLAYALWEARGGGEGSAEQDWLEAERRLRRTQLREGGPWFRSHREEGPSGAIVPDRIAMDHPSGVGGFRG